MKSIFQIEIYGTFFFFIYGPNIDCRRLLQPP